MAYFAATPQRSRSVLSTSSAAGLRLASRRKPHKTTTGKRIQSTIAEAQMASEEQTSARLWNWSALVATGNLFDTVPQKSTKLFAKREFWISAQRGGGLEAEAARRGPPNTIAKTRHHFCQPDVDADSTLSSPNELNFLPGNISSQLNRICGEWF